MARRDGTGPLGQGSMTGRKLGNCVENLEKVDSTEENIQASMGFRCRRDFGMKRQRCCGRQARRFSKN